MKSKKTNKSFEDILNDYNNILNKQKPNQPKEIVNKINLIQDEAEEIIEQKKKDNRISFLFNMFFFGLFIFAVIYIYLLGIDNDNLYKDNVIKTNIINNLQRTDSLFNQIMNVQYDSLGNKVYYFSRNNIGEIITYDELHEKKQALEREVSSLENKISDLQWEHSMLNKLISVEINPKDKSKSVSYLSREGKALTYGDLIDMYKDQEAENNNLKKESVDKYNELIIEINSLRSDSLLFEQKIRIIKEKYGIEAVEENGYIFVKGLEVDSALMLLPYYRDKLKYNTEKKSWTITLPEK